jgi:hypothetical protein
MKINFLLFIFNGYTENNSKAGVRVINIDTIIIVQISK